MHNQISSIPGIKKILYITILSTIVLLNSFNTVNAEEKCFSYSSLTEFSLYKERVGCLCDRYKPDKPLVEIENKFEEIEYSYDLPEIKLTHKTNMNLIYKCGILSTQKKTLVIIKEEFINKTPDLMDRLGPKIDNKIIIIDLSMTKLKCIDSSEKNATLKLNVLKQATFETCKYINYLEYLKETNYVVVNLLEEEKEVYSLDELFEAEDSQNTALDTEIKHTYKVFPVAFHAYTEYENNIGIHFLLELIKEDYMIFREKLHKVLNPINQVVYKISNAMRKE
ncbi:MAG: hypothetical protein QM490_00830 [Candidatus Gracilibacteria bacterium]